MPREKKQKPLATRLRVARDLVRSWRKALYDSEKVMAPGPEFGNINSPVIANELERFDEAYRTLTEAIAKEVAQAAAQSPRGST